MKCTFVFAIVALVLAAVQAEDTYTTENDDLDIEAVVGNLQTLQAFVGCFMDKSECDAVSGDFKKDLPEAVQQACAKCTPAQKHILKRFLEGIKEKLPQDYEALKKKYDSESKHFAALESAVANS